MGFRVGAYARVWYVDDQDRNAVGSVSVSKKNQQGEYEIAWADQYVSFYGDAKDAILALGLPTRSEYDRRQHHGHTIKITACDVTNHYDTRKSKLYTNYTIYGFEDGSTVTES